MKSTSLQSPEQAPKVSRIANLAQLQRWSVFGESTGQKDTEGNEVYVHHRIVGIHRDGLTGNVQLVATLNLTTKQRCPDVIDATDLGTKLKAREWLHCNYNPVRPRIWSLDQIREEHREPRKAVMEERLKLVKILDARGFEIFEPDSRSKAIIEACEGKADGKTHGESWVRDLLWEWWYYGGNAMAFVPHYHNCGAKSRAAILAAAAAANTDPSFTRTFRQAAETRARTKKPGCEIDPEMYGLILKVFQKVLEDDDQRYGLAREVKRRKGMPWAHFEKEIHKEIRKTLATEIVLVDGKPTKSVLADDRIPNRDQIRFIGRQVLNVPATLRKIKGSREFNLKHRGLHGDSSDIATKAGEVYEIDAFEMDLHCVNDVTLLPLGRLFIYFVVDVYSRAITGVYVTCGEPSYRHAVMALNVAFMPKSEWGKLIGLDISDDEWPMQGKPDALLADGGEMAKYASGILPELGTTDIANTPPCRGDLKGQVEQTGELADVGIVRMLPGATKGAKERCAEAPEKKAKLAAMKIAQCYTEWAYKVHNIRDLTGTIVDPKLIGRNVRLRPIDLWNDSIGIFGPLPKYSVDEHLPRMLPRVLATVTRRGLQVGDIYFDRPNDPVFKRLKEGATCFGGPATLAVHIDPCINKQIYMVPQRNAEGPIITVPLAHISRKWAGYMFKEVEDAFTEAELRGTLNDNEHRRSKIDYSLKIDEAVLASSDAIVAKYGSIKKRNQYAASIGKDIPRSDQLAQQLALEARSEEHV